MKQAEKFNRPIITFVDTPGAYPGLEAEMYGQSQAISSNLAIMSTLKVPVISIVTGEGSSGGALGIAVANRVYMLENAIYSVLSPEGFASILWHDSEKRDEAAEVMKLTAKDLLDFGVIDGIISERGCGLSVVDDEIHDAYSRLYSRIDKQIDAALKALEAFSKDEIAAERYEKFRNIDERFLAEESRVRMGNI
jgi:acetyl-CoA carboxylase carboxyl transferase alpha subunit